MIYCYDMNVCYIVNRKKKMVYDVLFVYNNRWRVSYLINFVMSEFFIILFYSEIV